MRRKLIREGGLFEKEVYSRRRLIREGDLFERKNLIEYTVPHLTSLSIMVWFGFVPNAQPYPCLLHNPVVFVFFTRKTSCGQTVPLWSCSTH